MYDITASTAGRESKEARRCAGAHEFSLLENENLLQRVCIVPRTRVGVTGLGNLRTLRQDEELKFIGHYNQNQTRVFRHFSISIFTYCMSSIPGPCRELSRQRKIDAEPINM